MRLLSSIRELSGSLVALEISKEAGSAAMASAVGYASCTSFEYEIRSPQSRNTRSRALILWAQKSSVDEKFAISLRSWSWRHASSFG